MVFSSPISAEFSISYAKTQLVDDVYLLNAQLHYGLTETVLEALQNGIPLTLVVTILVQRERWYLWDENLAILKQRYQFKYYAFSNQYVITYLNTGIQETFTTLDSALTKLNTLENFPLIDKHFINHGEKYKVYLQIHLDIESLPVPLRPIAHLSSQWRLSSDWYSCHLQ
jgi:hypothetical protein